MSTNNLRFKVGDGLDANKNRITNVASPVEKGDAVNLDYFDIHNSIVEYTEDRGYIKGFVTFYNNKIYIANNNINSPAGAFKISQWTSMSSSPTWVDVTSTGTSGLKTNIGAYHKFTTEYADLNFILPDTANDGDVVTFMDYGNLTNKFSAKVTSKTQNIVSKPFTTNFYYLTQPLTQYMFVYTEKQWRPYLSNKDNIKNVYLRTPNHKAQAGEVIYRYAITGEATITLPKYANHGDTISLYDLDGYTSQTPIKFTTVGSDYTINGGKKEIILHTIGGEIISFDNERKEWVLFDLDFNLRSKMITDDYVASPSDSLVIMPPTTKKVTTITLPKISAEGDLIRLSLEYMDFGQTITLKSAGTSVRLPNSLKKTFLKYSEVKAKKTKDYLEFSINPVDENITNLILSKISGLDGVPRWVVVNYKSRIEAVDPANINRYGVAKIASETAVNIIEATDKESIVTPFTLARRRSTETRHGLARIATLTEVIDGIGTNNFIVPEKLNKKVAKKDDIGLIKLSTQQEVDAGTDDISAVTPKTLHAKRAKEGGILGISTLVNTTGTKPPTTKTSTDGTNVYKDAEGISVVTPKSLSQRIATNTIIGLGFRSSDSDLLDAESKDESYWTKPTFITPEVYIKRVALETRTGISKLATKTESLSLTNNTVVLTPKSVRNIVSTDKLIGFNRYATVAEYYAGNNNTTIIPKVAKDHFESIKFNFRAKDSNLMGNMNFSTIWKADSTITATLEHSDKKNFGVSKSHDIDFGADTKWLVTNKEVYDEDQYVSANTLRTLISTKDKQGLTVAFVIGTSGTISSLTTTQITGRGRDVEEFHVTPLSLDNYLHKNASSRSKTNFWGTTRNSTNAESFVGNDVSGSTQALTSYLDSISVSPRSLHFALQNYLPLKAKAVDSDKIDGNASSNIFLLNRNNNVKVKQTFGDFESTGNAVVKDYLTTGEVRTKTALFDDKYNILTDTKGLLFKNKAGTAFIDFIINDMKANVINSDSLRVKTDIRIGGAFFITSFENTIRFGNSSRDIEFLLPEDSDLSIKKGSLRGKVMDTLNFDKIIDSVYVGINNDQTLNGQKTFGKGTLYESNAKNTNGYSFEIISGATNFNKYPPYEYTSRKISGGKITYVGAKHSEGILETFKSNFGTIERWRPFGSNLTFERRKTKAGVYTEWDEMLSLLNLPTTAELDAINVNETNFKDISVSGNLDILVDGLSKYKGIRLTADEANKNVSVWWVDRR